MATMMAMTTIRISKKRCKENGLPPTFAPSRRVPRPVLSGRRLSGGAWIESQWCFLAWVDQEWERFKTEACWLHGVLGGLLLFLLFHVLWVFPLLYGPELGGGVCYLCWAVGCLYLSGKTRSYISLGLFQC